MDDGANPRLVESEKEFVGAFQLKNDGPPTIIGASQSDNPELTFPIDFRVGEEFGGVHPRLISDDSEIAAAVKRYRETPGSFKHSIPSADHEMFTGALPAFPYNQPHDAGLLPFIYLARLAVSYRVTGDALYLKRLEDWLPFLETFQVLPTPDPVSIINGEKVFIVGEGNYDLVVGHILLGFSLAYDFLAGHVEKRLETALRQALVEQARLAHADIARFSRYPYEQNHLIIPVCGIGLAALVLADELPEARRWGSFAQGLLDRCFETIGYDGWFFEGIQYWNFTMQFALSYAAAATRLTEVDWFARPIFKHAPKFLAHIFLPDPDFVFDFNDHGPRVETDGVGAQKGYYDPWHTLKTKLHLFLPYLLNRCRPDPLTNAFIQKIVSRSPNFERLDAVFFMIWPIEVADNLSEELSLLAERPYHYFSDMDIVHWRENWTDSTATSIAFRASPPAGHYINTLIPKYPQWSMGLGHAHPDAGSFILFAKGKYLANDTAYSGAKETADHNSILVDGVGQHKGGTPWETFGAKPYGVYERIHLANVWLAPKVMASTAFFRDAYDETMQLTEMRRDIILVDGRFMVTLDTMASVVPHEYEWRLHGDKAASHVSDKRFQMENGPGRLHFCSLMPVASYRIDPTIVETEVLFRPQRSRPQQRGFHVSLKSPRSRDHQFLVAYGIQAASERPEAFAAKRLAANVIELSDEKGSCAIWIRSGEGLVGHFAYVLRDSRGVIVSAGLKGTRLISDVICLESTDQEEALAPTI